VSSAIRYYGSHDKMKAHAQQTSGLYFVFRQRTHAVLAFIDTSVSSQSVSVLDARGQAANETIEAVMAPPTGGGERSTCQKERPPPVKKRRPPRGSSRELVPCDHQFANRGASLAQSTA